MSETEPESEKERLERKLERKESELIDFQETPQEQIDARLSELADGIEQTNPRDPTTPDNRSMHEHLTLLREGIERDPDAWVNWRIGQIESEIEELEVELEEAE